jgi:sigma-B regulation protein RsbU (phosphoserine phosphatase)
MHIVNCAEIWGGIKNQDLDARTSGLIASLYSSSCQGGKGGDAYYFSVCASDRLTRLALADVVGHGEQVSRVSQWVYDHLTERMNSLDQSAMLADLNAQLAERGLQAMTTAVVVAYYLDNRHLYYSYAGHPPAYSHDGEGVWQLLQLPPTARAGNMPLGVTPETTFDMIEVPFEAGSRLLLYSDGVLEAPNPRGELFGQRRLLSILEQAGAVDPATLKRRVLESLRQWTDGRLDHDDVTLIAMQLL